MIKDTTLVGRDKLMDKAKKRGDDLQLKGMG